MERPNGDADEKQFVIGWFTERIDIVLVSLVGCTFNGVHGLNIYCTNHYFGDYCWYLGSI